MTAALTDRRADLIHVARTRFRIPLLRAGQRLTFTTTPEAIMDDELDTALNRVSLGIDALAAQRDRLATALRDILELAEDREDPLPNDWVDVATLARTALGQRGQANLPAVLAGLVLAVAAMWLVGWVGDHAAAGAQALGCITRVIGC